VRGRAPDAEELSQPERRRLDAKRAAERAQQLRQAVGRQLLIEPRQRVAQLAVGRRVVVVAARVPAVGWLAPQRVERRSAGRCVDQAAPDGDPLEA